MDTMLSALEFAQNLSLELELAFDDTLRLLSLACERLDFACDGDEYTDDDILRVARELYSDPDDEGI
jgi:hypothetical protein